MGLPSGFKDIKATGGRLPRRRLRLLLPMTDYRCHYLYSVACFWAKLVARNDDRLVVFDRQKSSILPPVIASGSFC